RCYIGLKCSPDFAQAKSGKSPGLSKGSIRATEKAMQKYRSQALSRRRVIRAAAAGVFAPALLRIPAALAAYPDRPVRIIVANSPGGPSDIVARIIAASLQQAIGGSFVVENKGGAGGNIGMGTAARA